MVAGIAFKVTVITSSVAKMTFGVTDNFFLVADISVLVAKITFVHVVFI